MLGNIFLFSTASPGQAIGPCRRANSAHRLFRLGCYQIAPTASDFEAEARSPAYGASC